MRIGRGAWIGIEWKCAYSSSFPYPFEISIITYTHTRTQSMRKFSVKIGMGSQIPIGMTLFAIRR